MHLQQKIYYSFRFASADELLVYAALQGYDRHSAISNHEEIRRAFPKGATFSGAVDFGEDVTERILSRISNAVWRALGPDPPKLPDKELKE